MKIHLLLFIPLLIAACSEKKEQAPTASQLPTSGDFQKGEYFNDSTSRKDSAFFYFNNVTENTKDSLLAGMAYSYMSTIQNDAGDYFGVQETALAGIKLLDEKNPRHLYCLASLYNVLGRSNLGLKDYDNAVTHFEQALKFQPYEGYKNFFRNNIAVALRDKGDYAGALRVLQSIVPDDAGDKAERARRLTNTASLRWKSDTAFNPLPDLFEALDIRIREKNDLGIISSYNHLAGYYMASNTDSAHYYSRKMYELSKTASSTDDELDALRKLTTVAPLGESRILFERYESLNDSLQSARNSAKNQFAVIRFESEKNKAENLLLQEDNSNKQLQILNQQIMLGGSVLVAALIIVVSTLIYRKKKQEAEQKSIAAIKEHQLKVSQKVHDTVANGLYRMMSEIEHHDHIEKEALLDKIEELYERSRDISYDNTESSGSTAAQVDRILAAFGTPATKISAVGNQDELWKNIPPSFVKELEQVLQELLVNMKKHSAAQHVVLHFHQSAHALEILYKDDGRGFPANFDKGNGLRSTENRILTIGGQVTFTSGTPYGAEIKIIVPIHNQ